MHVCCIDPKRTQSNIKDKQRCLITKLKTYKITKLFDNFTRHNIIVSQGLSRKTMLK